MNYLGLPVNPRVNQLDASLLDSELLDQLKSKLMDAFQFWNPSMRDSHDSELMLLLRALLFKVTIWDHSTTYGAKLQNLVLVRSSTKRPIGPKTKALYGCITVLGPYIWLKLKERDLLSFKVLDSASLLWNTSTLLNFVMFIFSGKYLTLVLRLLGAQYAAVTKTNIRNVNYEFQNRQLIWNALTEFLLFVLPLVNYRKITRKLLQFRAFSSSSNAAAAAAAAGKKGSTGGPLAFLPKRTCAICYEKDPDLAAKGITNPYTAGCPHPYSYVCLSLRLAEDPEWRCLRCNAQLSASKMKPFRSSAEAEADEANQ